MALLTALIVDVLTLRRICIRARVILWLIACGLVLDLVISVMAAASGSP